MACGKKAIVYIDDDEERLKTMSVSLTCVATKKWNGALFEFERDICDNDFILWSLQNHCGRLAKHRMQNNEVFCFSLEAWPSLTVAAVIYS